MLTLFEELNLYVYHSLRGLVLDVVIWCLHPLIYDGRQYGLFRIYLAAVTCKACRSWYGIVD
ncbi:MAG TPA: hypothetical protein VD788_11955 [Candidatus Polarisedimenticolaceae bacterium]|nr:hypothetical protein [Candidatus Polarisedimenticolaceae bacterium]